MTKGRSFADPKVESWIGSNLTYGSAPDALLVADKAYAQQVKDIDSR